ncbi:MAG: DEAD/DEAH box helicase [Pigmentiphaga sp.]|nr:DEAD/DEAH box helicase [Pigmentiphaga sp.]
MTSSITFADLGLDPALLRAVTETGYTQPTPIQHQAIPVVLDGHDLLAAAQTGTGKTAGFTLPVLQRLLHTERGAKPGRPRCLILTPTRELAAQVEASVQTYGRHVPLKSLVMFGGVNINPQIAALRKPLDILVATPGRLLDHVGQKTVDLSGVSILVLDEADRMLDMGFIRDIRKILALLPKARQTLLFSATFSDEIRQLAQGVLRDPREVSVAARNTTAERVDQSVHLVPQHLKRDALSHLIRRHDWRQVLVFTRTKHGANRLAEKLLRDGIGAAAIHGNKSQSARTRALEGFKNGDVPVLVATDIAARGLDIDQLPQVVNFELPNVPEDYVHRIGRTGRAGAAGSALSLVDRDEIKLLAAIEKLIKRPIDRLPLADFDLSAPAPAAAEASHPSERRGRAGQPQERRGDRRQPERRSPEPRQPSSRPAQTADAGGGRQAAANRTAPSSARQPAAARDNGRPQRESQAARPSGQARNEAGPRRAAQPRQDASRKSGAGQRPPRAALLGR